MAKRAGKKKRRQSCMMIVRVRVPAKIADRLKVYRVQGIEERTHDGIIHELQILSAYYDLPGQPGVGLAE